MSIGDYEPLWIGESGRSIYCALHSAPGSRRPSPTAVLLVPPLLHEQHRSHRFLCEMADCLAGLGLPCLRFNFFGTGDSDGEGDQLDVDSMVHDLRTVSAELTRRTRNERLIVIAFRSGALPTHEWLKSAASPDVVALWDPVTDGKAWLRELVEADAAKRATIKGRSPVDNGSDGQLMGYAASPGFRAAIANTCLADARWMREARLWGVLHANTPTSLPLSRRFDLPMDLPTFGTSVLMDATLILSPPMERAVKQVGQALLAGS